MDESTNSDIIANILVFDSGVGGLSIVGHIRKRLPSSDITYLADNRFFPYGLLSEQELTDRVSSLLTRVLSEYHIDIIVIACNTASTLVLPILRATLDIPVVGVVPAIKPAVKLSKNKIIGLLATPGTIRREYTDELIRDFAQECQVVRVGSNKLVEVVEQNMLGEQFDQNIYREILTPFTDHPRWAEMDTIVLACTHFPLAKSKLSLAAPEIKNWVDSGSAIAQRVTALLQKGASRRSHLKLDYPSNIVLLTDLSKNTGDCTQNFKRYGFDCVNLFEP